MSYARLPTDETIEEHIDCKNRASDIGGAIFTNVAPIAIVFALGLALGAAAMRMFPLNPALCGQRLSRDIITIPQVCISSRVTQNVRHYPEFEAPPPPEGGPEPVWDELIPDGLGYTVHPDLSPNMSVVAVFHQLHCLYLIRRAYYSELRSRSDSDAMMEDFDTGIHRRPHVGHCFDYLRQSLLCHADSSLEPTNESVNDNLNWRFDKECRDYEEVKAWAAQWKVFDIQGSFVPFHLEDEERT
ncbi:hypothetical protein BDV06DRAFT_233879 [Aspergillus oleicola]